MELTTRCPQCETVFSASLEQLQLRKGYIRCINCANIFDGFEAVVPATAQASSQKPGGAQPRTRDEPASLSLVRTPRSGAAAAPPSVRGALRPNTEPAPAPFVIPSADQSPALTEGKGTDFSIGDPRTGATPSVANEPTVGPSRVKATGSSGPYVPDVADTPLPHDDREPRLPSVVRERAGRPGPAKEPVIVSVSTPVRRPVEASAAAPVIASTRPSEREPVISSTPRTEREPIVAPSRSSEHEPIIASRSTSAREPLIISGRASEREPVIDSTSRAPLRDADPGETDADTFLYVEPRSQRRSSDTRPAPFGHQPARSRWMTPVWAVLALCGVVLLVAQAVYIYRAQLANTFPGLRPTLELACARISCSVPYERRLDAIAITGSALRANAAPEEGVSSLTLEVTLRNTYDRPQEWPTLVLDLKDASGTIVVRRNLPPQAWVPASLREGPFMPGADLTVQVPLAVQGVQANGYQLDKFFP